MQRFALFLLLCSSCTPAYAQDPPPPPPDPIISLMPIGTVPVAPTIPKLGKGERYVFSCKVKCEVDVSPDGLVTLVDKAGPRDFTGWFSGGGGADEDRTFAGPFLYELKAAGVGQVKVTLIPLPYNGSGKVKMLFDVDNGGPTPPVPPVPPIPPIPPTDPLTRELQAAFAADGATVAQVKQLADAYRTVASTTANDKTVTTYGQLVVKIQADETGIAPLPAASKARAVIKREINAALGINPNAPINRPLVTSTFSRLATALDGATK